LNFWSFVNLPWGYVRSHTKFGSDRFSWFEVYWIQTNNKQTIIITWVVTKNRFSHLLFVYNDELAGAERLGSDGCLYCLTPNIVGLGRHLELVQHARPVHGTRYNMVHDFWRILVNLVLLNYYILYTVQFKPFFN